MGKHTTTILTVTTVALAIAGTYFGVEYMTTLSDAKYIVQNNTITNWGSIPSSRQDKYKKK